MITLKVCWLQVDCLYVSVRRWRAVRVVKGWETIALGRKAALMRAKLLRMIFSRVFRLWLQRVVVLTVARRRETEAAARQRAAAACFCLQRWKAHRAQV
jgi:hypothetical protein